MSSQSAMGITSIEAQQINNAMLSSLQAPHIQPFGRNVRSTGGSVASQATVQGRQTFASFGGYSTSGGNTTTGYSTAGANTTGYSTTGGNTAGQRFESIMGRSPHSIQGSHNIQGSSMLSSSRYITQTGQSTGNRVNFNQPTFRYQSRHGGGSAIVGEAHVISERTVEHEVRVPKKVVREDIVEKVIVIPEKIVHEEVVEDVTTVREKIIEVAKPIYQERIIEVPETEYIERIVEVPEIIYQEKIKEVPRIEYQERIIEIPKIITQERIVEIPEIQYVEIPIEKVVEVPEIREQVVLKQVPVPQYVDRPVPEYVNVEVEQEVVRHVPIPIEAVTVVQLHVPKLRTRYTRQDVPLYVPRFIEIAMPAEFMDPAAIAEAEHYAQQVSVIASQTAVSICEVERLAGALKDLDEHYQSSVTQVSENATTCMSNAWSQGRFTVANVANIPLAPAAGSSADVADEAEPEEKAEVPTSQQSSRSSSAKGSNCQSQKEFKPETCDEDESSHSDTESLKARRESFEDLCARSLDEQVLQLVEGALDNSLENSPSNSRVVELGSGPEQVPDRKMFTSQLAAPVQVVPAPAEVAAPTKTASTKTVSSAKH